MSHVKHRRYFYVRHVIHAIHTLSFSLRPSQSFLLFFLSLSPFPATISIYIALSFGPLFALPLICYRVITLE